jgi:hypothetical protein
LRRERLKLSETRGCPRLREGELQVTPEGSAAAVVMLGIDGVGVLEAREIDGEIELMRLGSGCVGR